jgi:hypothetical protein
VDARVRTRSRLTLLLLCALMVAALFPPSAAYAFQHARVASVVRLEPPIPCVPATDGLIVIDNQGEWQCFCDPAVDDQGRLVGGYVCDWWLVVPNPDAPPAFVELRNLHSNLNVDVRHSNPNNGTPIQQYTPNGTSAQIFSLFRWDQSPYIGFQIRSTISGSCIGVQGGSTSQGAPALEWGCNGSRDQSWALRTRPGWGNAFEVWNLGSRFCLSVPGASFNAGIQLNQYRCGNRPQPASPFVDQLWHF